MDRGSRWATVHGVTKEPDVTEWLTVSENTLLISGLHLMKIVGKCQMVSNVPPGREEAVAFSKSFSLSFRLLFKEKLQVPTIVYGPQALWSVLLQFSFLGFMIISRARLHRPRG